MEKYSRGRRGAPAKGVGRETGARVQIPPSPPTVNGLKPMVLGYFFISSNTFDYVFLTFHNQIPIAFDNVCTFSPFATFERCI